MKITTAIGPDSVAAKTRPPRIVSLSKSVKEGLANPPDPKLERLRECVLRFHAIPRLRFGLH